MKTKLAGELRESGDSIKKEDLFMIFKNLKQLLEKEKKRTAQLEKEIEEMRL